MIHRSYISLLIFGIVCQLIQSPSSSCSKVPFQLCAFKAMKIKQVDGRYTEADDLKATLGKMPLSQQRMIFSKYIEAGIYVDLPEFWQILNDPQEVLPAISNFPEPYNKDMLDMLDRVLLKIPDEKSKIKAAAILYRYNRPSGYVMLETELKDNANFDAAIIFAVNQEEAMLDPILKLLPIESRYRPRLVSDLSKWQNPKIALALWNLFQQQPNKSYLALALADQDFKAAIPLTRTMYFSSADSYSKVDTAVALIKLDGPNAQPILHNILNLLGQPPVTMNSSVSRLITIQDCTRLKIANAAPAIEGIVTKYLATKSIPKNANEQLVPEDEVITAAAEALPQINSKHSSVLLTQVLTKFKEDHVAEPYVIRVAQALLISNDTADAHVSLEQSMGKDWLKRELDKRKLKPLPTFLMPKDPSL